MVVNFTVYELTEITSNYSNVDMILTTCVFLYIPHVVDALRKCSECVKEHVAVNGNLIRDIEGASSLNLCWRTLYPDYTDA